MNAGDGGAVSASAAVVARVREEAEKLVAVSSPSGDVPGAEEAIALCARFLGPWSFHRAACSTPGCADDLVAKLAGTGARRLLLLGHVDTVIAHDAHAPAAERDGRLYGPGTADMKGGVALALAVARALAVHPGRFAELAVLLVCDEEWRTVPFTYADAFAGYDGCLCFEAGERAAGGEEAVILTRKGAGTLRVTATGRAAHSGSAPHLGRNALSALARLAVELPGLADPQGPERLTIVPTVLRSGDACNVVPDAGELVVDLRAHDTGAFARIRDAVPAERDGVALAAALERVWPAMDTSAAAAATVDRAAELLGRPILAAARGGASDASHFAPSIPVTIDGLGPVGGDSHNPGEFLALDSLGPRLEVALALALAVLG